MQTNGSLPQAPSGNKIFTQLGQNQITEFKIKRLQDLVTYLEGELAHANRLLDEAVAETMSSKDDLVLASDVLAGEMSR